LAVKQVLERSGVPTGLVIFLVATAVMFLVFGLAVVGHGKEPQGPDRDEDDDRE